MLSRLHLVAHLWIHDSLNLAGQILLTVAPSSFSDHDRHYYLITTHFLNEPT